MTATGMRIAFAAVLTMVVIAIVLAAAARAQRWPDPEANFGAPPSGMVPIFYNDHQVYAKPDKVKQDRVLVAIARDGTVLVPLRTMFEQMHAAVMYDARARTIDVSGPGFDIKVPVGRAEVIVNGRPRSLDVGAEADSGYVVVPLRAIAEGIGAYVQWAPGRRAVRVRMVEWTSAPSPFPSVPARG